MKPKAIAIIGLSAVGLFLLSLLTFGLLHEDFNFLTDYISKLGYKGTLLALWWNIIGFGLTGLLLMIFGLSYGWYIKDKLAGVLLSLFGLGFGLTGIPFDLSDEYANVSKAHIAAITLGLAAWLFGLARIGYNKQLDAKMKKRANIAAGFLAVFMGGSAMELWSEPMAERLVFSVVFVWTIVSSWLLINRKQRLTSV